MLLIRIEYKYLNFKLTTMLIYQILLYYIFFDEHSSFVLGLCTN